MSVLSTCEQTLGSTLLETDGWTASAVADHKGVWNRFSSVRRHQPGEELFRQGSVPHGVYLISSGYVKVSSVNRDGRQLILGLRGVGSMLGVPALLLQEACPVSATAITYCESRYFAAELFVPLLKADSRFSWLIQLEQSRQARQFVSHILQLGFCSARRRLGELLWQLISANPFDEQQKAANLKLPLKQWEVAQLIAVTPEHLSRIAKQMQREGILQWTKGTVTVFDLKGLRDSLY